MSEKESVSVYKIIGARNNGSDEITAIDEGTIRVDLDMNDPKDILVSQGKDGYKIIFGGGVLELEITHQAAHALMDKLEGAKA